MAESQEKRLGLLEQGEMEVDSDSTLNEDDRPPTPVMKTRAQLAQLLEFGASRVAMMRPSFLQVKSNKTTKLRRTAYLDGIRGFASLLVYCLHHQLWAHAIQGASIKLENTWGWDGDYYFGAFPFIRTFFTGGHYAVATFFVMSGYVLSCKPLSLIQAGDLDGLGNNLASALFRRWIRLYTPIIAVTLAFIAMPHIFGIASDFKPQPTLRAELWKWYCDFKNFSHIWNLGGDIILDYQKHAWSIPVEMRGSITIWTAQLAFSRCTKNARLACEALLVFYFMYIVDGAHFAMFTSGMLLCDLDLLALSGNLPSWFSIFEPYKTPLAWLAATVSILLGGIPSNSTDLQHMRESPGWYYLSFLKPQAVFDYRWYFLWWAAVLIVWSGGRVSILKRFFESRFCQYLGRISYMFYLVHGPVLWFVGDRIYAAVGWVNFSHALTIPGWAETFPLPKWGIFGLEIAFLLPQLLLLPLTLWVAELATALVDDPSLKLAAWCYSLTQPPKDGLPSGSQRGGNNERKA